MHRLALPFLILAVPLAGCSSSSSGVSTASVLGAAPTPPAAAAQPGAPVAAVAAPVPSSTPTDRAFLVGSVSARAAKCGYNFDAAKLKSNFLANEMSRGTASDQLAQVDKVYAVAFNGVAKAAAEDPAYCSEAKTKQIKDDLNRLLAGDFEPRKAVAQKQEGGFFSDFFDGSGQEQGPKFGTSDWWEKQADKAGGG
jgi:hypothetical protein